MLQMLTDLDVRVFWAINSRHAPLFDYFFHLLTFLGSGFVVPPLALAIIFLKTRGGRFLPVAAIVIAAFIATAVVSKTAKIGVDRSRPLKFFEQQKDSAEGREVHVVGKPLKEGSFPSGHTMSAFSAATVLTLLFGRKWLWTFLVALGVAYSRVYMGVHFPLDTVGGAIIGALGSAPFIIYYNRRIVPAET